MKNTNTSGTEETPINKPKRKYQRSGKFSKKDKVTSIDTESVESETTTEINTGGLNIEFSPKVFQEIQKEEVRRIESEFRITVLNPLEDYITKLKIEDGSVSTPVELSSSLGQKSVNYSRELGPKDILTPQSEYRLRCHIGLKLTMDWATNEIVNLKRELFRVKNLKRSSDGQVVTLAPVVEPKPLARIVEPISLEQFIEPTPVEQTVVTE